MNHPALTLSALALAASFLVACNGAPPAPPPVAPAPVVAPETSAAAPLPSASASAAPSAPSAPTPSASASAPPPASTAGKRPAPSHAAVEPQCPGGQPVAFFECAAPTSDEPKGQLDAPFETCAEKRAGKPFSPRETRERRAGDAASGTCCYLDRCQISYGY